MSDINQIKWVQLTDTMGLISAELIAGRLRSEGIPSWVWQQGAGDAMGLFVGPLGFGHVMVPETMKEIALEVIADDQDLEFEPWQEFAVDNEDEIESSSISSISKAMLLILALAIDIPAVLIAFVITFFTRSDQENQVVCPYCESQIELNNQEIIQGWYICPNCNAKVKNVDQK